MTTDERTISRRVTAYHEAGHAIACILSGVEFTTITIVPSDDVLGGVAWGVYSSFRLQANLGNRSREIAALARASILIKMAGAAAELRLHGSYDEVGASSDWEEAHEIACYYSRNPEAYVKKIFGEAKHVVAQHWPHINKLAEALLIHGTLTEQEVYELLSIDTWDL